MNMGALQMDTGDIKGALENLHTALKLKPNYAEAYNNLGIISSKKDNLKEALMNYKHAIDIDPKFTGSYCNLGIVYYRLGKINRSIDSFIDVLDFKYNDSWCWNNILYPLYILKKENPNLFADYIKKIKELNADGSSLNYNILMYQLSDSSNLDSYFDKIVSPLSTDQSLILRNIHKPESSVASETSTSIKTENIISLYHWGRSGTGLLHSLIDGHSEVVTLPSFYFNTFFGLATWPSLIKKGWDGIVDNFINTYPVFFDSSSPNPILSRGNVVLRNIGKDEGLCNLGEGRDERLIIDKDTFRKELTRLVNNQSKLDALSFFKLDIAFEKVVNSHSNKEFYFITFIIRLLYTDQLYAFSN